MTQLSDIREAQGRIAPHILRTPTIPVPALDEKYGCRVVCKLESLQITGSFKLRGAMNRMLSLSEEELKRGVVCPSSGNHAQAVAYTARMLGTKAKIVMPNNANPVKLNNVRNMGAEVILSDIFAREQVVREIIEREGYVPVHAFADPWVRAGQGTVGLEMLEDMSDLDAIVVPMGGGGLISGIAIAAKALKPGIKIYGIEHTVTARYTNCRRRGEVVDLLELGNTIADGTRGNHADPDNCALIYQYVDDILLAEDGWLKTAMYDLITKGHVYAEPSSCMGLSVALAGALPVGREDKVGFVISGGNCDLNVLKQILNKQ